MKRTAWMIAAAAAAPARWARASQPWPSARAREGDPGITARLSAYMSEAGDSELPADAAEKTKHHILDTLAAMVSGVELTPARVALKFARAHDTEKLATIVGPNIL